MADQGLAEAPSESPLYPSLTESRFPLLLRRWIPLGVLLGFFCAGYPTLNWNQLQDPIEILNVATALEIRRGGPVLVPVLQGVPRLAKPPVTAWLTAAAIRPATLADLSSPDPSVRLPAYDRLATEARWPALLALCLMLAATYETGRALDGELLGVVAAGVCGTTMLFARHSRLSTTDAHLALWVAVTNLFLVKALVRGQVWSGFVGAGFALGVAAMCKGPVAIVQTALPVGLFAVFARQRMQGGTEGAPRIRRPILTGMILMLVVGGWWYLLVLMRHRGMGGYWWGEFSRQGSEGAPSDAWYKHAQSFYLYLPWFAWLVAGAIAAGMDLRARRPTPAVLALVMLVVPLLIMSLAKDRFERYVLPMTPAGALLGGTAIVRSLRGNGLATIAEKFVWAAHLLILMAVGIGFPIAAATRRFPPLLTAAGNPWLSAAQATALAVSATALLAAAVSLRRCRRPAVIAATVAMMVVGWTVYTHRRGESASGRSDQRDAADLLWTKYPTCRLYTLRSRKQNLITVQGSTLSIYMNRAVAWADRVEQIPPTPEPQAWLVTRSKTAPPLSPPAGWTLLAKQGGGEVKYVFVRAGQENRP